jgi:hypothetical protein
MKFISITAALGALMFATTAVAGPMDIYFENTLVVHGDAGDATLHFNADNSYVLTAPAGNVIPGQWELRDDKLCMTDVRGTDCWELGEMSIGETVTSNSDSGQTARLTIRAGR